MDSVENISLNISSIIASQGPAENTSPNRTFTIASCETAGKKTFPPLPFMGG
jgi:hypothetical protein